jgi:hypothetical protein
MEGGKKLERLRHVLVRSSQIGKLKLDATFLRRERDSVVHELGEAAIRLMRVAKLAIPEELRGLYEEANALEGKIESGGRLVEEMRKESK